MTTPQQKIREKLELEAVLLVLFPEKKEEIEILLKRL